MIYVSLRFLASGDGERTWSRSPSSPSKPDSEFFLDGADECARRALGLVSCSNAVDIVAAGGADREARGLRRVGSHLRAGCEERERELRRRMVEDGRGAEV